jgi:hypothetical protein
MSTSNQNNKIVYVVHAVDTEGPLYVDLSAKFELLEELIDIEGLERTQENLDAILAGEFDFGEKQAIVCEIMSSHRNNYMDNWEKLGGMLDHAMAAETRCRILDSFGQGYVYNWFCLDHIGFEVNPRRREMGFHKIHDYYARRISDQEGRRDNQWEKDGLHWHFHPMPTYKEAHRCATSVLNSPHIFETLARRIIERRYFPASVRCGFQTERPDTHWFLEQYIPFDFTNTAKEDSSELEMMADLAGGRFGDWRRAPTDWLVYQPSHDDYQVPGNCRRYIARALNILSRFANIDRPEVEKAFARADSGKPTLLAIATHDFRDLAPEAAALSALIVEAQRKFPDVKFKFAEAQDAMRSVIHGEHDHTPLELKLEPELQEDGFPLGISIKATAGQVFGPQPFLAIELKSGRTIHDNLDFGLNTGEWHYVFDHETVRPEDCAAVGVGAADKFGHTSVKVCQF